MPHVPFSRRTARLAMAALPSNPARRLHGLGRPLAALLALAVLGGAVTTARSLLDLRGPGLGRADDDWPMFVAALSRDPADALDFAPVADGPSAPVRSIDTAHAPLRIDIMGLSGIAGIGRIDGTAGDGAAMTVPAP